MKLTCKFHDVFDGLANGQAERYEMFMVAHDSNEIEFYFIELLQQNKKPFIHNNEEKKSPRKFGGFTLSHIWKLSRYLLIIPKRNLRLRTLSDFLIKSKIISVFFQVLFKSILP